MLGSELEMSLFREIRKDKAEEGYPSAACSHPFSWCFGVVQGVTIVGWFLLLVSWVSGVGGPGGRGQGRALGIASKPPLQRRRVFFFPVFKYFFALVNTKGGLVGKTKVSTFPHPFSRPRRYAEMVSAHKVLRPVKWRFACLSYTSLPAFVLLGNDKFPKTPSPT